MYVSCFSRVLKSFLAQDRKMARNSVDFFRFTSTRIWPLLLYYCVSCFCELYYHSWRQSDRMWYIKVKACDDFVLQYTLLCSRVLYYYCRQEVVVLPGNLILATLKEHRAAAAGLLAQYDYENYLASHNYLVFYFAHSRSILLLSLLILSLPANFFWSGMRTSASYLLTSATSPKWRHPYQWTSWWRLSTISLGSLTMQQM